MKPQVENKTIIYTIVNMVYMLVVSLVALGCSRIFEGYTGLILGLVFMVIGIPFAVIYKKYPIVNMVIIGVNAIFTGIALSSVYTATVLTITLVDCALAMMLGFAVYLLFMLINKIPFMTKHKTISFIINLALVIGLILIYAFAFEILVKDMFVLAGILSAVSIAFVIVMQRPDYTMNQLYRSLTICSYSVFVVAVAIAIIIISDGDAADGVDLSDAPDRDDIDLSGAMIAGINIPTNEPTEEEKKEGEEDNG